MILMNVAVLMTFLIALSLAHAQEPVQSFTVRNESDQAIWAIQASPEADQEWGEDRLGDTTLAPREEFRVRIDEYSEHCVFDIRIIDESLSPHVYQAVNLCEVNSIVFPPRSSGASRSFTVRNESNQTIWTIQASPEEDQGWGKDRLGENTILSKGEEFQIEIGEYAEHCMFDIRVRASEGFFDTPTPHEYKKNLCEDNLLEAVSKILA